MKAREARRAAIKFIKRWYGAYAHWNFDITEEESARRAHGSKVWSFGLRPDEEDPDHGKHDGFVGYVHADGHVEGLY